MQSSGIDRPIGKETPCGTSFRIARTRNRLTPDLDRAKQGTFSLKAGKAKKGRRLLSGPSFSGLRLGGRGIGRYQLLMRVGIAACRAVRKRGALLAAHSPSVRNNLP